MLTFKQGKVFPLKEKSAGRTFQIFPKKAGEKKLKGKIIEFKSTDKGLKYRVIGLDQEEKTGLILWGELPKNFPKDKNKILAEKDALLPEILKATSEAGHTHPHFEEVDKNELIINFLSTLQLVSDQKNVSDLSSEIKSKFRAHFKCTNDAIYYEFYFKIKDI